MGLSNTAGRKDVRSQDAEPNTDQATKEITASELAAVLARVDGEGRPTTRPPVLAQGSSPPIALLEGDEGRISGARRIVEPRTNLTLEEPILDPTPILPEKPRVPRARASRSTWVAVALLVTSLVFAIVINLR